MFEARESGRAHLLNQGRKVWVVGDGGANRQRVYEVADQRPELGTLAARSRAANNHFILPHVPGQEHMQGGQQAHEQSGFPLIAK